MRQKPCGFWTSGDVWKRRKGEAWSSRTGEEALQKPAKSFSTYAEDLASHIKDFEKKTGAEAIHDGFGVLTESEEVTSACIELSEGLSEALEAVQRHLDELSDGIRTVRNNVKTNDEELAQHLFSGGTQ